jgi:hypothetical protein
MKKPFAAVATILLLLPVAAFAHRLDEYLEATILSIDSGRVDGSMRLVPGVAVASQIVAAIDTNADGAISAAEQQAYVQRVLHDLFLSVDGHLLPVRLVSASFPAIAAIQQGVGEIHIVFTAPLPPGGDHRKLVFENHHESGIAVYLVNCLVPDNHNIQLGGQTRDQNQSFYQLDFVEGVSGPAHAAWPGFSGFAAAFRLGVRHIAEGTDHLLFLLALLLPAPLLATSGRWSQRASLRRSLMQILRIVTAFTLGHSLTLALAAFGIVQVPSRPVEVLIAVSILISGLHAVRPIFPGREAVIAAFFGLIHGLAFASALSDLGFTSWYRLVSLLGFNLGIESMQLIVVAAMLPSMMLLSRTRSYSVLRIGGASFAIVSSLSWIVERSFNTRNVIDPVVEAVAHEGVWLATALLVLSIMFWKIRSTTRNVDADA